MKELLKQAIHSAINSLQATGNLPSSLTYSISIEATRQANHGDFASSIAMELAKQANALPRDLCAQLIKMLPLFDDIEKIEIAGPGFINFFMKKESYQKTIAAILDQKERYGFQPLKQGKKAYVEFVSSNPTGPLHVGHGRHAAVGASIANLLQMTGYTVHREYYVNDAGRQMDILATSVWVRYLQIKNPAFPFPDNAYRGDYVIAIAAQLMETQGDLFYFSEKSILENLPLDENAGGDKDIYIDALAERAKILLQEKYLLIFNAALNSILNDIRSDLSEFGVTYDRWFSEREFIATDVIQKGIAHLKTKNLIYEAEGALWFRATQFGDEKDRVILRKNGLPTYFSSDLFYHIKKYEGFDLIVDVFGSDHHGYIPRIQAGIRAMDLNIENYQTVLVQFVTLYRAGRQAQMSTRSGSFVTLRELRNEVGNDAARFFYVMRRVEQHMDFDLDLAKSTSQENPVYYIQYAHARICSVFCQLKEQKKLFDPTIGLSHFSQLQTPQEIELLKTLMRYPDTICNAAQELEPYILVHYLRDLANQFHSYYNSHQFIVEEEAVRQARLTLIAAIRQVLQNALSLLGVSAPESM